MNKVSTVLTISLTLAIGLATAPPAALANHHGSHGHSGFGGRVIVGGPVVGRPFVARPFVHHHFPRAFTPFVVLWPPVVVYSPPPVYYAAPPVYYGGPTYYGAPSGGTVAVVPSPPPTPSVIQYPTGRYELRGDGITTPYIWVWIPNPPAAPPPPPAPPAGPPASPGSSPSDPAPHSQLYRWTDDQGVVHWTDRWDAVPEQHHTPAKRLRPA